jgi:hypothetical protein
VVTRDVPSTERLDGTRGSWQGRRIDENRRTRRTGFDRAKLES